MSTTKEEEKAFKIGLIIGVIITPFILGWLKTILDLILFK